MSRQTDLDRPRRSERTSGSSLADTETESVLTEEHAAGTNLDKCEIRQTANVTEDVYDYAGTAQSNDVVRAKYEAGLRAAQREGDVDEALDPEVTAWALMGAGELIGMRYLLWERDEQDNAPSAMPEAVIDHMTRFIRNALEPRRTSGGSHD